VVVAFLPATSVLAILACRGLDRRVVVSERNDPDRQVLQYPWAWLRRHFYNHADVVTANSHGALKTMKSYVNESKLAFVPNPRVRPGAESDSTTQTCLDRPFVLTVGRIHPQKALDVLLDAFALLPPRLAGWHLYIVGRGDAEVEARLREQSASLGIAHRVHWSGQVADPFPYYRTASIFALPSRHEGMPNALMEAMGLGLPVVVTDGSPGPLELVTYEGSGLVVPVGNAQAVADAIERYADDEALRRRMGEAAAARVSEYDLPSALVTWEKVIGLS